MVSLNKSKNGTDGTGEKFIENGEPRYAPTFVFSSTLFSEPCVVAKIDEVGWLSFVSFSWIFSYLWAAYKGRIDGSKTWNCSIFDSANVNMTRYLFLVFYSPTGSSIYGTTN